mmetsp:Transcript_9541/g.11083  ORF Transcript_9541/g.11083 Transcript_9541/m.11083 type:complete len:90 (-) Transcript_9541:117-386(-)
MLVLVWCNKLWGSGRMPAALMMLHLVLGRHLNLKCVEILRQCTRPTIGTCRVPHQPSCNAFYVKCVTACQYHCAAAAADAAAAFRIRAR